MLRFEPHWFPRRNPLPGFRRHMKSLISRKVYFRLLIETLRNFLLEFQLIAERSYVKELPKTAILVITVFRDCVWEESCISKCINAGSDRVDCYAALFAAYVLCSLGTIRT